MKRLIAPVLATLFVAGCQTPTVNLSTAQPIKVDIDMRLDVYEHSNAKPGVTPAAAGAKPGIATSTPETRRNNRMADIQQFKNSQIVGEDHNGLVAIVKPQDGEFGEYVRKTVDAENADRMELMNTMAEQQKISLPAVQQQQGVLWYNRSFKGEMVQVRDPAQDNTWKWVAKEGDN